MTSRNTGLLDSSGRAISATAVDRVRAAGGRLGASYLGGSFSNGGAFPYDAAAWDSPELGNWSPWLRSPDGEINQHRDRMVARQRDLVRNDGWASGLIGRILDSTIGPYYRLTSRPDYRALAARFGPAFDKTWADEYRRAVEANWRSYADDPGHHNDVTRSMTVTQQLRLMLGHKLVDGEDTGIRFWLPELVGRGGARYASALLVVDPDRLSNPQQQPDQQYLRGGVELNARYAPIAYHFRQAHQGDWYTAVESMTWERVVREDDDGFQRVIHDFDRQRAGQNRGVSIFAPVLSRLKMLARYYGVELQAATIASIFGTYVTSPYDQEAIQRALDDDEDGEAISVYATMRESFHEKNAITLNNARMSMLAPGERIETVASNRPYGEFSPFAHEMLRSVAAAAGVSGEQVTQDYSEVNFSSMRVGIVNSEKTYARRVADFNSNTATPVFAGWLHEAMDIGDLDDVLPRSAPTFMEARAEYSRNRWLGAARGWYDPVAERQGKVLGLEAGFDTLEDVCAEQGDDWEENLDQRAVEAETCRRLGLPPPSWLAAQAVNADKPADKPTPPEAS